MGTYNTVVTKLTLKEDTPPEVVQMLRLLVSDDSDDWKNILDMQKERQFTQDFFCNERWMNIFGNGTGYEKCKFTWVEPLTIDCVASIKNYGNLVPQFVEWIRPFVDMDKQALVFIVSDERDYDYNDVVFLQLVANIEPHDLKQVFDALDLCGTVVYDEQGNVCRYYSTNRSYVSDKYPLPVFGALTVPNTPKDTSKKEKRKRKLAAQSKRRNRK